tara:strand:- start:543 stop:1808 length:1266 start_codon:yes stop_codon:yes gene_type:complete
MGINIVDKRDNPKGKSSPNRQKLLKRIGHKIKKAMPDIIKKSNVKDLTSSKKGVKIPVKGINEPQFGYEGGSGDNKRVHPGNKEYTTGDKIKKPRGGDGERGQKGSNDPTVTEDDFTISISREEFLEYFFEDLELPDMVKKHLNSVVDFKQRRAGFTNAGSPNRLNVVKSYKNSMSRKMATSIFYDKKIKEIEDKLQDTTLTQDKIDELNKELKKLINMKTSVNFMEEIDLQYNNYEQYPVPITSAVMFCIMDVSASMGEKEKDISKRFFMLLYMFLTKQYERIEIVFIRHHTQAKEVDEDEFFNSRESGGTIVLPALELMDKIITDKYSTDWNIYAAQASDGDVWDNADAISCGDLLRDKLLNKIQYMVYIEIARMRYSNLWEQYENVSGNVNNFKTGKIQDNTEIWDVFKDFFKKRVKE